MLRFHILNVGQGDSIVIEHHNDEQRSFGVVDSFARARERPSALSKLEELEAESLSFICLTHPHRDHYRGLSQILHHYRGRTDQFIAFPAGEFLGSRVKDLARRYQMIADSQDDPDITMDALEFVRILKLIDTEFGMSNIPEYAGPYNQVPVTGFDGVEIFCALPFKTMKGSYLEKIRNNDASIFESEEENNLSLALVFRYRDVSVVLGGDATRENWEKRLAMQRTRNLQAIHSIAVKMPHHGSKRDCTNDTLNVVFPEDDDVDRFALISANGVKLPHEDVLSELETRGIKPYCTNLHRKCGANVHRLINTTGIDPILGKYLNQLSVDARIQPCQGDITFTIYSGGGYALDREYNVPCGFRGEFGPLFA